MKISVFGLGYVGAVASACLARDGISVVSVDVNPDKVTMVASGHAPVVEPGLPELLKSSVISGRLQATTSAFEAVMLTDMSLVTVGTPSRPEGSLDVSTVLKVCDEIGAAVAVKKGQHVVVIRSTVMPGTTALCAKLLHAHDPSIEVAFNPEFMREGTAIEDYKTPAFTVIGTTGRRAEALLRELYRSVSAPIIVMDPREAEVIKLVCNAWHATKIAFSNEIGRLGNRLAFDAREVMGLLIQDRKLNISSSYMRPGFAFGGSCLPKDLRALTSVARIESIDLPLLSSLIASNQVQIDFALRDILATEKRRIGIVGLAFKAGTDDLRESPAVELAERLIGKGCELRILDPAVCQAKLVGANRQHIENKLPHLSRLLVGTAAELLDHSELIVVTHHAIGFEDVIASSRLEVPIMHLCCITNDSGQPLSAPNNRQLAGVQTGPEPESSHLGSDVI